MPDSVEPQAIAWNDAVAAALDWWRDAGVDHAFIDDPQDWLAQARAAPVQVAPPPMKPLREQAAAASDSPPVARVADRAGWPGTLDAFAAWWLEEAALSPPGLRRLPPAGPAAARLMVVVPMPAADDGGALLDGRAGRLLDAMLATFGLARADTYLASALPAHMPMPDWETFRHAGLGEVLLHHIALAAPRRILFLGASGISALLGHDPTNLALSLRAINQDTAPVPVLSAWDLDAMLARPALKAALWNRWLDWTGTESL